MTIFNHKDWAKGLKPGIISRLSAVHFIGTTLLPATIVIWGDLSAITAATNKELFEKAAPSIWRYIDEVGPGLIDEATNIPVLGLTKLLTGLLITRIQSVLGLEIVDVKGRGELLSWIKEAHTARWVSIDYGSPDPNCASSLNLVMGLGARKPAQEDITCDGELALRPTPKPTPPSPLDTPTRAPTLSPTLTPPTPTPRTTQFSVSIGSATCTFVGRYDITESLTTEYFDVLISGTATGVVGDVLVMGLSGKLFPRRTEFTSAWTGFGSGAAKREPGDPETTTWTARVSVESQTPDAAGSFSFGGVRRASTSVTCPWQE